MISNGEDNDWTLNVADRGVLSKAGKIEKLEEYLHMKLARHKDFDSFLEDLTSDERIICLRLKDLIQEVFPESWVSWAYGVPYFNGKRRICFLYPASFPYSGIQQGVNLGFVRGYQLSNTQGLLEMGKRKEVGYLQIQNPGALSTDIILEYLHEAVLLDQMTPK